MSSYIATICLFFLSFNLAEGGEQRDKSSSNDVAYTQGDCLDLGKANQNESFVSSLNLLEIIEKMPQDTNNEPQDTNNELWGTWSGWIATSDEHINQNPQDFESLFEVNNNDNSLLLIIDSVINQAEEEVEDYTSLCHPEQSEESPCVF